jgi:hypothetical protein
VSLLEELVSVIAVSVYGFASMIRTTAAPILTSGIAWTARTSRTDNFLYEVAYGSGTFVEPEMGVNLSLLVDGVDTELVNWILQESSVFPFWGSNRT